MSRFPSEQAFVSWLGLTPSRDISGGKVIRMVPRKVANRAAQALTHGRQHTAVQRQLSGCPLTAPAEAAAQQSFRRQSHGPLPGGHRLSPAHQRTGLGRPRSRNVRAKAQDAESGLSRGPRSGQRVPSGACYRRIDRDHPVCSPARPPRPRVSSGTMSAARRLARLEHRSVPSQCLLTRLVEPLTSQLVVALCKKFLVRSFW
jgi:Transposase IS116/IS110/IS902 family